MCIRDRLSTVRSGIYEQNQPSSRGVRRASASAEANSLPHDGPATVRQPLIPPVSHTAQSVQQSDSRGNPAVNSSENWEEEIDEFGSQVFHVESSFFRSGTK